MSVINYFDIESEVVEESEIIIEFDVYLIKCKIYKAKFLQSELALNINISFISLDNLLIFGYPLALHINTILNNNGIDLVENNKILLNIVGDSLELKQNGYNSCAIVIYDDNEYDLDGGNYDHVKRHKEAQLNILLNSNGDYELRKLIELSSDIIKLVSKNNEISDNFIFFTALSL